MTYKSVKVNTFIYTFQSIMSVLFPLITAPYALRVLGVENIGRYNFVGSIIGYFSLLASLGLGSYGSRDGAIMRDDRKKFSRFASEILSLNIYMAIGSYFLLFLVTISVPRLYGEKALILISSLSIIMSVIGVEWIYKVYEDYLYVTIRKLVMQFVSLGLLFVFVREGKDLIVYAIVNLLATVGNNVWNLLHSKKFCDLRLVFKFDWRKYLSKSLIFFASSLMITIYVNTDQTILGFIWGDYECGLYSASVKVYRVLDGILTSAAIVGVARLSNYAGNNKMEEYKKTANEILEICITFLLPAVIGVCFFCKEIILIIGGHEYVEASTSLFILSIALLGYVPAVFWGQCVLVANGKEQLLLLITMGSAALNLVLNFILIPFFKQDAAAFTTFFSESITAILAFHYSKKFIQLGNVNNIIIKCIMGCAFVILISALFKVVLSDSILAFILSVFFGGLGYIIIEFAVNNSVIRIPVKSIVSKFKE